MKERRGERTIVRGRGLHLQNLRVVGFLLSVFLVPMASVPGRPGLSVLIALTVFLLWQAALLRPRLVIDSESVHVYWVFRSLHRPVSSLESVDLASSNVLWYSTKELSLVLDDRVIFFPWIGWSDTSESLIEWPGERSQKRVLDKIRSAVVSS